MDELAVRTWFDQYLAALAALGRNESDDLQPLLDFYALPLVVATDDAATAMTGADEVAGFARQQVAGMRAASYDHTETLQSELTMLNSASSLDGADFVRVRADGTEIGRLGVTYFITLSSDGLRISALAVKAA